MRLLILLLSTELSIENECSTLDASKAWGLLLLHLASILTCHISLSTLDLPSLWFQLVLQVSMASLLSLRIN